MSPQAFNILLEYLNCRDVENQLRGTPGAGARFLEVQRDRIDLEAKLRVECVGTPVVGGDTWQGNVVAGALKPAWLELCDAADAAINDLSARGEDPQAPVVARLREAVKVMRAAIATGVDIRECGPQAHRRLVKQDRLEEPNKVAKLTAAGYKLHPSRDSYWKAPGCDDYLHEDDIELVSNG